MLHSKPKRLYVHPWRNYSGALTLRRVLPLAKTRQQIMTQFYRQGMWPSFQMRRLWQWQGHYCWMDTIPMDRMAGPLIRVA